MRRNRGGTHPCGVRGDTVFRADIPRAAACRSASRGRWSGSVALGVITIRSSGLAYAVPQGGGGVHATVNGAD